MAPAYKWDAIFKKMFTSSREIHIGKDDFDHVFLTHLAMDSMDDE